ncbi:DUF6176 family protein [Acinetobacter shaoyimingii]|uniref:Uncharacterized protein n=1 Tax=Acinetobacter shaoyimingii TaxID=2715164 RepID=A0A6G8RY80_9GAMM|nr:DUF6176 family protein [Acinetobacter shaoyimingii]QIO06758.1 hypothetical protein G8E00_12805 [Acinetobacter shaoyimingii]
MDIGAVLIELKENRLDDVAVWQAEINARKQEAIETLKAERVFIESWFQLKLEGKDYLIAYMRADDIHYAQQVGKSSQFPIDQIHKAFKQNWARVIPAQILVDLENTD